MSILSRAQESSVFKAFALLISMIVTVGWVKKSSIKFLNNSKIISRKPWDNQHLRVVIVHIGLKLEALQTLLIVESPDR